jgi:hypothetical protein
VIKHNCPARLAGQTQRIELFELAESVRAMGQPTHRVARGQHFGKQPVAPVPTGVPTVAPLLWQSSVERAFPTVNLSGHCDMLSAPLGKANFGDNLLCVNL